MRFEHMKVSTRLGFGFILVLSLLIIITVVGVTRVTQIENRLEEIALVHTAESRLALAMRATVTDRAVAVRNLVLMTDDADRKPELERVKEQGSAYASAAETLNKMFAAHSSPEEKPLLEKIDEQANSATPLLAKAIKAAMAGSNDEVTEILIKELRPVQRKWLTALDELIQVQDTSNKQAVTEAASAYSSARATMLVLGAFALLVGGFASVYITRGLQKQLGGEPHDASAIAGKIACGDLTVVIDTHPKDLTSMLFAMKAMRDSLVNIVAEVRTGTSAIAVASGEIASGNLDLSARTEQQASSLEETASSMEELTSTVKQNAESARLANELAMSASEVAIKGGSVVSQVVDTMGSINDSARKIVDIIGVIDGIAFQTNILALNAAVEAARAGEQGRGFAVVAAEVRNLAQRSAGAAKEIKNLIGDSVEKVDIGARLVDEAGATMQEIVDSIRRVTDIMGEITIASHEQSAGIEQVNQAIAHMDEATMQNASLVEEAAAAAQSLQDQATNLSQVVSVFKLDKLVAGQAGVVKKALMSHNAASGGRPARKAKLRTVPKLRTTPKGRPATTDEAANASTIVPSAKKKFGQQSSMLEEWEQF